MDIFANHLTDWMIVLGLLGLAFYTMKVIGSEQSTMQDESYSVAFSDLLLSIPNWWSITSQTDSQLRFERTDTRYEWYANYIYFADHEGKDMPKLLEEKLNQEEIEFDIDVVFETDSRVLFRDQNVAREFQEVIRVEGRAAQRVTERIYYDIFVMRRLNDKGYFIFESRSSVLNGFVEGPYFEESLAELKLRP